MKNSKGKIQEWIEIPNTARPKIRYWLPAAAVDEADLKQELKLLKDRGFGGVEIADLMKFPFISRSEDGWGTEHWSQVLKAVGDTTEELGISMDVTNGSMWPISSPVIKSADELGSSCELTYGVTVCTKGGYYCGKLPKRNVIHEEGTPILIQVLAYLEREENVLLMDSFLDLNSWVKGKGEDAEIEGHLPPVSENCRWRIFAFYYQPTAQRAGASPYYVIDHFSEAGAEACEKYWMPVMKQLENLPSMESFFCDSLEYTAYQEWTPLFPQEFFKRREYSILPFLPFICEMNEHKKNGAPCFKLEDAQLTEMIQADYAETLTQCFCENHLTALERMANKFGKTMRYQVAYNKLLEVERSALYVTIPENEALGRVSLDYQRTMAAAAHLGRKERYSFECAAEYTNAYGQEYEDLLWWVKRSQMAGMNAQVLHGASYSGAYHGKLSDHGNIPGVKWPGFEAFRKAVSNYWNRTLSIEDARACMDTIARTNVIFMKKAKVDCAIYRQSFHDDGLGSEFCLYEDDGVLSRYGYNYETVSPTLLNLEVCKVTEHELDKAGVGYRCLIIPFQRAVSFSFLKKVQELLNDGFPVIWLGEKPKRSLYYAEWYEEKQRKCWQKQMEWIWENSNLIHLADIKQVPDILQKNGIYPRLQIENPETSGDIVTAVRIDQANAVRYYAIYGYNRVVCTPKSPDPKSLGASAFYRRETVKGDYKRPGRKSCRTIQVKLEGEGKVYWCNPWNGKLSPLDFVKKSGHMCGSVSIEEDEMILLAMFEKESEMENTYGINKIRKENVKIPVTVTELELEEFKADTEEETSFLRSHFTGNKKKIHMEKLLPWYEIEKELELFAGRGIYHANVYMEKIQRDKRYILKLEEVSDTFRVYVNGEESDFPDQVLKEVDITELLHEGENEVKMIVTSNLYNRLVGAEKDIPDMFFRVPIPYHPKRYGICGNCYIEVTE